MLLMSPSLRGWGRDGLGTGAQGRGREGAQSVDVDYARCVRLQRGCGVWGWGPDGLGTGRREGSARVWRALMSTRR